MAGFGVAGDHGFSIPLFQQKRECGPAANAADRRKATHSSTASPRLRASAVKRSDPQRLPHPHPLPRPQRTVRHLPPASASFHKERRMSSFGIYVIGFVILIVGLALAANMLGIPTVWIGIGAIVLIGIAVLSGVAKTRQRDRPDT
jgi:hypothetical protein